MQIPPERRFQPHTYSIPSHPNPFPQNRNCETHKEFLPFLILFKGTVKKKQGEWIGMGITAGCIVLCHIGSSDFLPYPLCSFSTESQVYCPKGIHVEGTGSEWLCPGHTGRSHHKKSHLIQIMDGPMMLPNYGCFQLMWTVWWHLLESLFIGMATQWQNGVNGSLYFYLHNDHE